MSLPATTTPRAGTDVDRIEVTFIGTATTLIRGAGFTILTDPNFLRRGERAKLGLGLRSPRLTDPAVRLEDLPHLDLLVLSHHHGDHFDDRAAAGLPRNLPIVTTPHAARKLERQGFTSTRPLATWASAGYARDGHRLRVTAMPGKHSPPALASVVPPVMGSMFEFRPAGGGLCRLYVTGDTLMHEAISEIPRRYPSIDLALLHLGGTRIGGVLLTMDDRQGVEMLRTITPRRAAAIHYHDYPVFRSPLQDFLDRATAARLDTGIVELAPGETYRSDVPAA